MKRFGLTSALCALAVATCQAQYSLAWARQLNGTLNTVDWFADMTVDELGNAYVAGTTNVNLDQSASDIFLAKYSPLGTLVWQRAFDGPAHGPDTCFAMALGGDGFIYVVGRANTPFTSSDYATIKYRADDGALVWSRLYDGPISSIDQAMAVGTDNLGNVFVTGEVWNQHFQYSGGDYATIKYDSSGTLQWAQLYNGPSNQLGFHDQPQTLVVDHNGDVIVSGDSPDLSNVSRIATIKYRGTDGTQQWAYRSESNSLSGNQLALGVTSNNDVIVAGNSQDFGLQVFLTRLESGAGNHLWTMRDSFPHGGRLKSRASMAIDPLDNAAISVTYDPDADNSNLNYNIQTTKYRLQDGARAWSVSFGTTVRYDGQSAEAVAMDGEGNVYVSGSDLFVPNNVMSLWKFASSDGNLIWKGTYNGPKQPDVTSRIRVDSTGNLFAAGITGVDVGTGDADIQVAKFGYSPSISGHISFGSFIGAPPSSVTFQIRNAANTAVLSSQTVNLGVGNSYQVLAPGAGDYVLSLKPGTWLRTSRPVTVGMSNLGGIDLLLLNGDVDDDNEVGIGDYAILSAAYGSFAGGVHWTIRADLDGSGAVDIGDYAILSAAYGRMGDD